VGVQVDPVEQRTGDARKVALDQGRRAVAFVQRISVKPQGCGFTFWRQTRDWDKPQRTLQKVPARRVNKFGLPEKIRYRTADVCALLGISSDLLRWRFLKGKYSEVRKDGGGRT
jgi:hypothetical protein